MSFETVKAVGPFGVGALQPLVDWDQAIELKPRRTALAVAGPADEAGALEHLEVLGDGRLGQRGGFRELHDAGFAGREALEDCPPRGVGKRREGEADAVKAAHH